MPDLEVLYRRGVPLALLLREARLQKQNGALEVGAMEFLFSVGVVEECPCRDQAKT